MRMYRGCATCAMGAIPAKESVTVFGCGPGRRGTATMHHQTFERADGGGNLTTSVAMFAAPYATTYDTQTAYLGDTCDTILQATSGLKEEIRTVFITGFPEDVKERELNNMLRFLPGYQAAQMNWKNGQAQGFALFSHAQAARAAIDALHSLCFDDKNVLRAELARKNMYLRDDCPAKRPRISAANEAGTETEQRFSPARTLRHNPPCNTLFIGNLSDSVSKQELEGLFAHQPGFQQMKLVRAPRGVNCFIEFLDVQTATLVHESLQGSVLASSDRGALRIEYSKNPLGRKRDKNGHLVNYQKVHNEG